MWTYLVFSHNVAILLMPHFFHYQYFLFPETVVTNTSNVLGLQRGGKHSHVGK